MPTPNTEYCHKSTCTEIPKFKLTCYSARKRRRGLWARTMGLPLARGSAQAPPRAGKTTTASRPSVRHRVAAAIPALQFLMKSIDPAQLANAARFGQVGDNRRRARPLGCFRVGAASSLVSISCAGGFDEACGFATLLAGIRIFDELK
jgi:hypothetical protein